MITTILLILGLVCFILAAFNVTLIKQISIGWLGLAFWIFATLIK